MLHSVRGAIAAGYLAYVPVDACGGMSSRTEDAASCSAGAIVVSL
jgi:nicotinamidase-related amidase